MYSKAEVVKLKHEFWTVFGRYLSPHLSSEGERINWINYKTGIKQLYFKMDVDTHKAVIEISLEQNDRWLQDLYFDEFKVLKPMLKDCFQEDWLWEPNVVNDQQKMVSRIYKEIKPVNILNKNDWPQIISFFKPRLLALEAFWSDARPLFESLV